MSRILNCDVTRREPNVIVNIKNKSLKEINKTMEENSNKEAEEKKTRVALITLIIIVVIVAIGLISDSNHNTNNNQAQNTSGDSWYYLNKNYQCLKTTNNYQNQVSCSRDTGTFCHDNDPTCGGAKKLTFYYIDSTNHCVLAPHNPYSPLGRDLDGQYAELDACMKDVGQYCYADDSTCGGAGTAGVITINGIAFKLVTPQELKQNINNSSSSDNGGDGGLMVAVKGTIYDYRYDSASDMPYTLVINSNGDYVIVDVGNTNGFNIPNISSFDIANFPKNFPKGTNVIAAGAFMNNLYLGYFSRLGVSDPDIRWLESLGLPKNTPIILSGMGIVEKLL